MGVYACMCRVCARTSASNESNPNNKTKTEPHLLHVGLEDGVEQPPNDRDERALGVVDRAVVPHLWVFGGLRTGNWGKSVGIVSVFSMCVHTHTYTHMYVHIVCEMPAKHTRI